MSSGGLLLLLGVLTLWAQLTPVSGKNRPEFCNLPADMGPCKEYTGRFYYDSSSNKCEVFIYGGCPGNANNFKTRDQCRKTCVEICILPADMGPCDEYTGRFYYDLASNKCEIFIYGGCQGNANNFKTRDECRKTCNEICIVPPDMGPCDDYTGRFYYDSASNKCEIFIYGGCQGNDNNFKTRDQCRKTCVEICILPPDMGPCDEYKGRFYYDSASKECKVFVYGGCQGNANNFKTRDECRKTCVEICSLPPDMGPCDDYTGRFYYDPASNECKVFTYGGCQGNDNNFKTRDECRMTCNASAMRRPT